MCGKVCTVAVAKLAPMGYRVDYPDSLKTGCWWGMGGVLRKVRPEGQAGLVGSGATTGIAPLWGRFLPERNCEAWRRGRGPLSLPLLSQMLPAIDHVRREGGQGRCRD